jgi:hypothetical protein
MIVVKVTSTENKIIIKKGDDAIAKQFALASQASAIAAGESETNAEESEQVATQKAAQTVEDAAEALASKQDAESAATASGGFASDSGISATASELAKVLSEAAKVIAIQEAGQSSTSAGQSAASAFASEAAKNLSVSAKDTAISKASEANSSSITATTQAGISTAKATESAQSAAQSLLSRNEAAAILANTLTGGAVEGQVPFWNGPKNLIGNDGFVWDNVNKRLLVNSLNSLKTLSVGGDVEVIGQTINPLVNNYSFIDIKNPVITAALGTINTISLIRAQGTLNFNTLNQRMVGIDVDITSNATQSHIPILARMQTSANAVVQSQITNKSNQANAGNELRVSTGTAGVSKTEIVLSTKSTNPFNSGGVYMEDGPNSNYWAVGTANNDYLRFFHNSNSAAAGSVNPTAWIRNNRMFIGRYAAFLPLATLHIKGEGSTLSTTSFLVENSTSQRLLTVLDNGNTGFLTTSPTEALDVNGKVRIREVLNATGNPINISATGVFQQRTPLQHINDILTSLPTYNAAIFQTLTHNASGVIAWT